MVEHQESVVLLDQLVPKEKEENVDQRVSYNLILKFLTYTV